jgi:phage gp29-like protein
MKKAAPLNLAQKTASKSKGAGILIQNITLQSVNRQTQDIGKWRRAIQSADSLFNPSRVALYDLLDDICLDGHLTSVIEKRHSGVKRNPLVFTKNGKEDEEINKVLASPDMVNLLEDLVDTFLWGFTIVQINNIYWNEEEEVYKIDYDLIPRKHVHPEKGFECISKVQAAVTRDFLFKEPPLSKYMIWAGKEKNYGLLTKAAQYVIYKRGGFGDWAEYAELFGRPFREARYKNYDDATRMELEKMLKQYGGAGYAILPEGAEFKLHQATTAASSNILYESLIKACNEEISKIIVGQTMTTVDGSSLSQSEVHKEEQDDITAGDRLFIINILDSKFKSILRLFGFSVEGGIIRYRENIDLTKLEKKVTILMNADRLVPLDDDYVYEELGIPKPKNYDELKEERRSRILPQLDFGSESDPESTPQNRRSWFSRFF